MAPVAEQLRRARERAELSLEDLSQRTKIQLNLLDAMERGDFARVPGGLFVRGFLRAYAKEVRLDPEAVVADYLEEYEPQLVAASGTVTEVEVSDVPEDVILAQTDAAAFSWRKVWPMAAIVVVVVGIFMTVGSGSRTASVAAEAQPVGTSGQAPAAPAPAPRPSEGLTLDMRAKRDVWVAATADGQRVVYRILKAGEHLTVNARGEINARIGDADAFEYSVNGVMGQPLGAAGEVRDILMTPGNFRTFKVERPAPRTPETPQSPLTRS
jgi:transcriptional regulator with XRE-family HTH domain